MSWNSEGQTRLLGFAVGQSSDSQSEFYCHNNECSAVSLVKLDVKDKGSQCVTDLGIRSTPSVVNGFTSVFQVEGKAARLDDLKLPMNSEQPANTIFRIVPGTHSHIVNYVIVENDGDSLRKINENDPATKQKLLDSQKACAAEMLKKIVTEGKGVPSTATVVTTGRNINAPNAMSQPAVATQPAAVQLAHPRHPNLKITAVTSADAAASAFNAVNPVLPLPPAQAAMPIPMPIDLPMLQSAPTVFNQNPRSSLPILTPAPNMPSLEIDRMNVEIQELRLTVARLAEAQAKKQKDRERMRGVKRPLQN